MSEQDNRPVNLEALDPTADTERFDRMVSSIMDESRDELASRRAHYGVMAELGRWRRPMMAAAAVAAALSVLTLTRIPVASPGDDGRVEGIVEALGVPTELAQWIGSEELPSAADIAYGYAER